MKMFFGFLTLIVVAGLSGMLLFLNQEKVAFVLTPPFGGVYYMLPEMPLGLLVALSFFLGVVVGYIGAFISRFFK
ncbi:MAG: hypothetical protein ACK4LT_01180 [Aquificaceae bacterium]